MTSSSTEEYTDGVLDQEGCRQRVPHFDGSDCAARATPAAESSVAHGAEEEEEEEEDFDIEEYNQFVFPHALDGRCLAEPRKPGEALSEEDEDTDTPTTQGFGSSIMQAKMFTDPVEREKWKNRGWRAVQCCGGALLVLALIFDEMD
mmetsp:Transcript_157152/g.286140  ORF Transcript_157152/g.286140 Transcript_157152/m.286140 type:complete len:147 (-) Transcript_157152:94-534(-)